MDDIPEMWTEEAVALGCTCAPPIASSTAISPPEPKRDPWCPLHGKDPDYEREKQQDHLKLTKGGDDAAAH